MLRLFFLNENIIIIYDILGFFYKKYEKRDWRFKLKFRNSVQISWLFRVFLEFRKIPRMIRDLQVSKSHGHDYHNFIVRILTAYSAGDNRNCEPLRSFRILIDEIGSVWKCDCKFV